MIPKLFISFLFVLISFSTKAQFIKPPVYFDLNGMENLYQIDSLKNIILADGFILVRESAVQMINNYESTIFLPLRENNWYKFVFVGDLTSKTFQQRLYDFSEKKLIALTQKLKDAERNIIQFDYVSRFSEFHALKSMQINKTHKLVSGYFLLFRKVK